MVTGHMDHQGLGCLLPACILACQVLMDPILPIHTCSSMAPTLVILAWGLILQWDPTGSPCTHSKVQGCHHHRMARWEALLPPWMALT